MNSEEEKKDCPHCGRCPKCGRSDVKTPPWVYYPPVYIPPYTDQPYPPQPYTITWGSTS